MEFTVLVYPAEEGGYWTRVPALPGCGCCGESVEEAIENTREAIACHVCALKEDGQEISCACECFQTRVTVDC
ncbi:MAG: type II toxin-antitoxin system HicB family antitoxin [Dehalococcoidia bacterium]|nr:type II toxin-antitoxin system HicB family antitoxin [Dehalococcoidia bacterium]